MKAPASLERIASRIEIRGHREQAKVRKADLLARLDGAERPQEVLATTAGARARVVLVVDDLRVRLARVVYKADYVAAEVQVLLWPHLQGPV